MARRRPVVGVLVAALTMVTLAVPVTLARAAATVANPDPSLIAQWRPCQPGTGVTVTVDFSSLGDHKVYVGCAPGDQSSGASALKNAGFTIAGTKQYGENFICRINALPGPEEQDCLTTPGGLAYWSYWVADKPNGIWGYSSVGAKDPSNHPKKGTFQGWSFSTADGRTVLPRVAPVDSRGADVHNAAPLASSTTAGALAREWLGPVLANAVRPVNAEANLSAATAARLLRSLDGVDVDTQTRTTLSARLRDELEAYVTGGDAGRLYSRDTSNALLALTVSDDARDSGLIRSLAARLRALMYPAGAAYPEGTFESYHTEEATFENGYGGVDLDQSEPVRALLAATGSVPAPALAWLLSTQTGDGESVPRSCGDDGLSRCDGAGPVFSVTPTVGFITALREVELAGPRAIDGAGIGMATIRGAIAKAGSFLARAQRPDGGYVGNYPNGPRSQGLATTWTTAQATRGLAQSGQSAAARRAARWLAAAQFTEGTGAPADLRGSIPADPNYFASQAANGLGADPRTTADPAVIDYLYSTEMPDVAEAMQAWRAVHFRNASIAAASAGGVTGDTARVAVELVAGTDDQRVRVGYGALGATRAFSRTVTVKASEVGVTASVPLTGLRPVTTYTFQVTATGGGAATVSAVGSFTTAARAGGSVRPDLRRGVAYLIAPARLVGGTHYQPSGPGFTDVGLTTDVALALAATGTADRTLARITAFVAKTGGSYSGVGTRYAAGGAVAKLALLAQVTGHDPRRFGKHDLVAALRRLGCTRADKDGCAAAGNYRYAQSVFGQAIGVIAQKRAKDPAVAGPAKYLRSLQHPSGAFPSVIPGADSEVDSTAIAAMALDLQPGPGDARAVLLALRWLSSRQLPDGGFPGAAGDSTNSAALAIQGLSLDASRYRTAIARARAFLAARQNDDGGFEIAAGARAGSDVRASAQAVGGASGTSFGTLSRDVTALTRGSAGLAPAPRGATPAGPTPSPATVRGSGLADTGLPVDVLVSIAAMLVLAGGVLAGVGGRGRRPPSKPDM